MKLSILLLIVIAIQACKSDISPCHDLQDTRKGEIIQELYLGVNYEDSKLKKDTQHIANETVLSDFYGNDFAALDYFKRNNPIDFSQHTILIINFFGGYGNLYNLNVVFNHTEKKVVFEVGELVCPKRRTRYCEFCNASYKIFAVKIPVVPDGYQIIYNHYTVEGKKANGSKILQEL